MTRRLSLFAAVLLVVYAGILAVQHDTDDLHRDVATLMIARAFAETYKDMFEAPVPEPLIAILRQIEGGVDRDRA